MLQFLASLLGGLNTPADGTPQAFSTASAKC
jgi:hypothetical protein